jgi:hypothetical protein
MLSLCLNVRHGACMLTGICWFNILVYLCAYMYAHFEDINDMHAYSLIFVCMHDEFMCVHLYNNKHVLMYIRKHG